ncbi:uncharacterized protein LOC117114177 [Anneissia japonica]|uniref:uncharacterized protein LOC117114177 n=1 Tax=Anneissia japonica TaxID=1529436 RepID=UPI0014255FB4|nr:uncharacterized protein LOC117114177 [Anneissia japonica]
MIEEIDTTGPAYRKKYTCRMMSQSVNRLTDKNEMVTGVSRKHREYLTHIERLENLHHASNRNRNRTNFTNKLENFRLSKKNKQLDSKELHQMRAFFKTKHDLKFNLVDIAKTKRRLNGSETVFERHLRNGSNEPVFQMEYNRLRHKEQELQLLKDRLEAPNSQILAKRVIDELRNIDLRSMKSDEFRMAKFNLLPPIAKNDDVEKSDVTIVAESNSTEIEGNQEVQSTERIISGSYQYIDTSEVAGKKSKYEIVLNNRSIETTGTKHARNIKSNRKRFSKDVGLPNINSRRPIEGQSTHNETNDLSQCNSKLVENTDKNTTMEIVRREKETEERLADLKEGTKYDIQKRRTSSLIGLLEPRDSLKTLKCFETISKMHLKNSSSNILDRPTPKIQKKRTTKKETQRRSSDVCSLPPLKLNTNLVRELKHQRIRHKKESEGLPKLP